MTTIEQTTTDCPNWCQSKPHDDPDGGFDGPHTWPALPATGLGVDRSALFNVDLAEPGTDEGALIYVNAPNLTMTAAQAHEAGLALLSVASWAKAATA